jgi:hypothetical protein
MHLTAPSRRSRSIGAGGRDPSEQVVTILGMRNLSLPSRNDARLGAYFGLLSERVRVGA